MNTSRINRVIENMHAHGLKNVCIHPFPKGFRDWFPTEMEPGYLTDAYLDTFAKVVRRAGELGMHAYLYDEGGWPDSSLNLIQTVGSCRARSPSRGAAALKCANGRTPSTGRSSRP